ncbi:TPA: DUF805 domain-containing protein [Klebsiella aerogenes]|uniref:DUF805 domain-containing protein n=1 Tax=Klebsiella aerogenes TaxID=548 RepID=A0AAW9LR31_KLEAE|nr:DUF805 domain-containing protein [Klebsiella aerogenes]EIV3803176.1 DUF805 domain-containing protein [Klebsiella aerogenes]EIV7215176.1 DUF805 domain-containing protein [Klebsiella aerogenes]EKU7810880.1 DUF805 domain-containing protein [Klebsiella aerogenes]EKW1039435.1 DUF805 domain-containing protein [Klebsiella aerogenes]EKZ5302410.1 DUF805 domain-containing protein [Klebsiella aerogenes]
MTYGQAYLNGWKEAFNFTGRAGRLEFWAFLIFNLLILSAPLLLWYLAMSYNDDYGMFILFVVPVDIVLLLPMTIPMLAVGFRRMHDIGRSGLWFLPGFIFPWFFILSLAMCCLRSAPAPSR